MVLTPYSYGAIFAIGEDGRCTVSFPDLPEALTDGADEDEALAAAADCLSEALASRIVDGEEIPPPIDLAKSPQTSGPVGLILISPDLTIALKAALYTALRRRDMTVADLADLLDMGDWHQGARLLDPKRSTKTTTLIAALDKLGCDVKITIDSGFSPGAAIEEFRARGGLEVGRVLNQARRRPAPTEASPTDR
jgi:antitoxin HicB